VSRRISPLFWGLAPDCLQNMPSSTYCPIGGPRYPPFLLILVEDRQDLSSPQVSRSTTREFASARPVLSYPQVSVRATRDSALASTHISPSGKCECSGRFPSAPLALSYPQVSVSVAGDFPLHRPDLMFSHQVHTCLRLA